MNKDEDVNITKRQIKEKKSWKQMYLLKKMSEYTYESKSSRDHDNCNAK